MNVDILIEAMNEIANYDSHSEKPGICPYGCDTPHIAREALKKYYSANACKDLLDHKRLPGESVCCKCGFKFA